MPGSHGRFRAAASFGIPRSKHSSVRSTFVVVVVVASEQQVPSPWICVLPASLPAALRWYADPYGRSVLGGCSSDVKQREYSDRHTAAAFPVPRTQA